VGGPRSPQALPPRAKGEGQRLLPLQGWFFSQLQPGARRAAGPVAGTDWLPARARVEIYADMYLARLVDALGEEYPRLAEALGASRFNRLATAYLSRFPSRHPTIQDVGDRLPAFLRRELRAGRLGRFPFVADLALLERVGSQVYLAAAEESWGEPVDAGVLRKTPSEAWPRMRFRVNPTLRIVRLVFRFPKGGKPVREKVAYRVYRRDLEVYEAPMDPAEARALSLVSRGGTFGEACQVLRDVRVAATVLATWVDEGLLGAIST